MKPLYDQLGQTWNKAARLKQLFAGWMRYLIVMDPSDQFKLAGFCAYRIEKQGIYMYELQLDEDYRSKGLGSSLIEMLRHIAKQQQDIKTITCTCLKPNVRAYKFYTQKHNFEVDEEHTDYWILKTNI